jgi:SAM-dependent methyltransferase
MAIKHFKNLARMFWGPLRERGLTETFRSVASVLRARKLEEREAFDERFGTDTGRHFTLASLAADGDDVPALWRYWPTLRAPFAQMMRALPVAPDDCAFIDYGSGKGRALLFASELPFRHIIGVELSPALHKVAQNNVSIYRSPEQQCHSFELRCGDAADFMPPEMPIVCYLFQPFPAATFAAVLQRLSQSLRDAPRPMVLAYLNPLFDSMVRDTRDFEVHCYQPAQDGEFAWAIYHHSG